MHGVEHRPGMWLHRDLVIRPYATMDGIFQQCLLKHLSGDAKAVAAMQKDVRLVVCQWFGVAVPAAKVARRPTPVARRTRA